jgi:Methyl-accepting chemotaxis protein (MCP) signaling domain.
LRRASNDQATEIAQITQGVEQVSIVVQTNSATAEESAAAGEELSGQAEMLKQMVGTFKLKNNTTDCGTASKPQIQRQATQAEVLSEMPQIILDDMENDKY